MRRLNGLGAWVRRRAGTLARICAVLGAGLAALLLSPLAVVFGLLTLVHVLVRRRPPTDAILTKPQMVALEPQIGRGNAALDRAWFRSACYWAYRGEGFEDDQAAELAEECARPMDAGAVRLRVRET